jgi:hypothetical protein
MATYEIKPSATFEEAMLQVLAQFRAENPSIGAYKATLHDGSTVILRFRDKPPKARKTKGGSP